MRYAGIIENDIVNGEGICLSYWTQGCPHKCDGCHNPETWNFNGGKEDSKENILNKSINISERFASFSIFKIDRSIISLVKGRLLSRYSAFAIKNQLIYPRFFMPLSEDISRML